MKLNKQQQQQWNTVTSIFTALSRTVLDAEALQKEMATWVDGFEALMANEAKVKIRMLPEPSIELIDCSKDFVKITCDDQGYTTLRSRVHGIAFNSTVAYKENYKHSNAAVIDGFRALADSLEKMPVEMRDQTGTVDIYALIGVSHAASADEEELEPQTPAGEVETTAPVAVAEEDPALIQLFSEGDEAK